MSVRSLGLWLGWTLCIAAQGQPQPTHNLKFDYLPKVWDEALPVGNGTIGALIWEKEGTLRFSLDRSDLWDLRPMKGLHRDEFSFQWVRNQVLSNDYQPVQEYFDKPYDREPAPTKIPGGALEFDLPPNIRVLSSELHIKEAVGEVRWDNGMTLKTFVHATKPVGWFIFEKADGNIIPRIVPPRYQGVASGGEVNSVVGDDLVRLGYEQGIVTQSDNSILYEQKGWGGFSYKISVTWKKTSSSTLVGTWSISSHYSGKSPTSEAAKTTSAELPAGFHTSQKSHTAWWTAFWDKSSLRVPNPVLEKQWYLEMYKFGSAARRGAPPISLQAVWTADHGRIPPWKGDFHHDLNTQLSYWPAYSGNHLEEALGYLDHLDENKENYKRYTKRYFGVDGLNVPGVTTLDGTEMGGWIQYSLSPTVSAWLAHHYYLHWRYSMDRDLLRQRTYPWFKEVCTFLEQLTKKDENGFRQLPLSSSPEINDNKISAWFLKNTNHDLSLIRFAFEKGAELAGELGLHQDAKRWKEILGEFADFAISPEEGLMFAPEFPYHQSHRHLSHVMAIHPLTLIKWEDGEEARKLIRNSLRQLEIIGPDLWCGYSYSWMGSLQARAKNGEAAAKYLEIFAKAFCLPNSFHANGDQTKSGYSKFMYRPFTLEGNFAFAAGLQEMLLQSYAGFIEVMPAIPDNWQDCSFEKLRAEGAYLVSARKKNGKVDEVRIKAEQKGKTSLKLPSTEWKIVSQKGIRTGKAQDGLLPLESEKGGEIVLKFSK